MGHVFRHRHEKLPGYCIPARFDALPWLDEDLMRPALRLLAPEGLHRAMRRRVLPLPGPAGGRYCAVADEHAARWARRRGLVPVARLHPATFLAALEDVAGPRAARNAAEELARRRPDFSARRRLSCHQKFLLIALLNALGAGALLAPEATLTMLVVVTGLFFLLLAALRLAAAAHPAPVADAPALDDDALPVYTVLVPLYREDKVLGQLIGALNALDYPAEKLDIKLLVEEADAQTRAALERFRLPAHFEVLTVPDGQPRTKPRALNYGLAFARGELVTIFDAEDIPQPAQLRRAAALFAVLPEDVACLQAQLAWYNADASFFTRQIAIEYAMHFDVVLPFMAQMGMPLPLGGTSNHFRMRALDAIGRWDPHNVTEDADLGIRLARLGWRAHVLPGVTTWEEACATWRGWLHQRARWIKGWLQTWLVHMREPAEVMRQCGWRGQFVLHAMLGAGVFAALAHPFFLLLITAGWLFPQPAEAGWLPAFTSALSAMVLVLGYGASIIAGLAGLRRRGLLRLAPWLVTLPLYWLAISAAAWLAVWDFAVRPHHWRKTAHGRMLAAGSRRARGPARANRRARAK